MDEKQEGRSASLDEITETTKLLSSDQDCQEHSPLAHELSLPDKDATPDRVREWLLKLLLRKGLPRSRAVSIASRWVVGAGSALRTYPIDMYRGIFDSDEDVWTIYAAVKAQVYREAKVKESSKAVKVAKHTVLLAIMCFCALVVFGRNVTDTWTNVAGFFGLSSFTCLFTYAITTDAPSDPADRAEAELRYYFGRMHKASSK